MIAAIAFATATAVAAFIHIFIDYCSRNLFVARWDALFKCWLLPRHGWRKVTAQWWCHHSSTSCTFLCRSIHFEVSKLYGLRVHMAPHTHTYISSHATTMADALPLPMVMRFMCTARNVCVFICEYKLVNLFVYVWVLDCLLLLWLFFFRAVMLKWLCWLRSFIVIIAQSHLLKHWRIQLVCCCYWRRRWWCWCWWWIQKQLLLNT